MTIIERLIRAAAIKGNILIFQVATKGANKGRDRIKVQGDKRPKYYDNRKDLIKILALYS
tara:strand:+ start:3219 stop:3398 length:180 start_codon:yes stop_codon:yes gene_type:complete